MTLNISALEGERVIIFPMEQSHVGELFEAGNHSEIWNYMPMRVESVEQMALLVDEALKEKENGSSYPFVIYDKQLKKIVGSTRFLDISLPNRNLEIGWTWYSPEVWRTRVNTECKYLLLRYCFEELNLVRVQFKADKRNVRSNTAIARIGAIYEGTLRRNRIMHDGYIRDSVYHSILDSEWKNVKNMLLDKLTS